MDNMTVNMDLITVLKGYVNLQNNYMKLLTQTDNWTN